MTEAGASDREVARHFRAVADVGEPVAAGPPGPRAAGEALATRGGGGAKCKLAAAQVAECGRPLDAGPAGCAGHADQRGTLARGRGRGLGCGSGVEYTLAGTDSRRCTGPAGSGADSWPAGPRSGTRTRSPGGGRQPGRGGTARRRAAVEAWLRSSRTSSEQAPEKAEERHWTPAAHRTSASQMDGSGDHPGCHVAELIAAPLGVQTRPDPPHAPRPGADSKVQGLHRGGLREVPGRRAPAARRPARGGLGRPEHPHQPRDAPADRRPHRADGLPAAGGCAGTNPSTRARAPPQADHVAKPGSSSTLASSPRWSRPGPPTQHRPALLEDFLANTILLILTTLQ